MLFIGNMGSILKAIKDEGFEVSALQMFRMDKIQAEEFLEVYKGVVSEYPVSDDCDVWYEYLVVLIVITYSGAPYLLLLLSLFVESVLIFSFLFFFL